MPIIKKLWSIETKEAIAIHPDFGDYPETDGVCFCVNEDNTMWFGAFLDYSPTLYLGEECSMVPLHSPDPNPHWDALRQVVIKKYLNKKENNTLTNECQCDMITLMNQGCPSTKGGVCPNA